VEGDTKMKIKKEQMEKLNKIAEELHELVFQLPHSKHWHLVHDAYINLRVYTKLETGEKQ